METLKELKEAIAKNTLLVWNDPDPIEDNDYLIDEVLGLDKLEGFEDDELSDAPILIKYGGGSEAEVLLGEIGYAKRRQHFIVSNALGNAQESICEGLYQESIGKVYDYANKVNMPYSHCGPCEADTPTIVRYESDTCALCGSGKEIQEKY